MARRKTGFYSTIEYIGPRPAKPKRPNYLGGWVIVALALGLGFWFGRPLVTPLLKADGVSFEEAQMLSANLDGSTSRCQKLAAAALRHSAEPVAYDPSYYRIAYPNGDIPHGKGAAADVVIRCLRQIDIDLQKEVHEDMSKHFRLYPQLWNAKAPDPNIDHRRIENLQRYFERHAQVLSPSTDASNYRPGDIVIWSLTNADKHIGIVVPGPGKHMAEPWVVHHSGSGLKWENALFEHRIDAHFRCPADGE